MRSESFPLSHKTFQYFQFILTSSDLVLDNIIMFSQKSACSRTDNGDKV